MVVSRLWLCWGDRKHCILTVLRNWELYNLSEKLLAHPELSMLCKPHPHLKGLLFGPCWHTDHGQEFPTCLSLCVICVWLPLAVNACVPVGACRKRPEQDSRLLASRWGGGSFIEPKGATSAKLAGQSALGPAHFCPAMLVSRWLPDLTSVDQEYLGCTQVTSRPNFSLGRCGAVLNLFSHACTAPTRGVLYRSFLMISSSLLLPNSTNPCYPPNIYIYLYLLDTEGWSEARKEQSP